MKLPPVVSQTEWKAAVERLREKEKQATRARDALAAERRRLPRVRIEKDYLLQGPDRKVGLIDLFEGRRQLLLCHFMFGPNRAAGCPGCSMVLDQICHLSHVHARDTSSAAVSLSPIAKIAPSRKRRGWNDRWCSSFGTDLSRDFELGPEVPDPGQDQDGETFGLSAFLQDGGEIYRAWFTQGRGVETLGPVWTLLDLTALGRQESWEDSPEGYPQTKPYQWWRRHDEYGRR